MIIVTMDVLAYPADSIGQRQPIPSSRQLWNALFATYHGRMLLIANKQDPLENVQNWLKREDFKPSMIDLSYDNSVEAKVERARHLRAVHGNIHWFLDTEPETVRQAVREGISSLLVAVPYVSRPEWHYDKQRKSWDDLSAELDQQALLRAEERWREL